MDQPVLHEPAVDGPQTEEDARVATIIAQTPIKYPPVPEEWNDVADDDDNDRYFADLKSLMTRRYIEAADFFIEEMKKESLSVVNAAKLANHLINISKSITDIYRLLDDKPLSDVELKTKFENVVKIVKPLIDKAIEAAAAAAAKGGSRNKSRSRKHKKSMKHNKSRNHKKSRKHKKSSKKSKRL